MPVRARVVGLGSPFGDDRVAWEVIALLRAAPLDARAEVASDPFDVVDCPPGCEILVVVDACRGAGAPGSVHRFEWPDPRLSADGGVSSHGVGLVAALELAGVLGRLPPRVIAFAVEGASAAPGTELSAAVRAAVPGVVARVRTEIAAPGDPIGRPKMTEPITSESLRALSFLAPATDGELSLLVPAARAEEHPAGAVLFREGDHLPHVFIVTAGTVALEVAGADHRPHRFQTVGPGELLGWSPLLGTGPMTATARAVTAVRAVALDAQAVLDACERDPWFGYLFMRRTAAAIAARLNATRLQLLDVYKHDLLEAAGGRL